MSKGKSKLEEVNQTTAKLPKAEAGSPESCETSASEAPEGGPYSHLEDGPEVGPGEDFTAAQKAAVIEANKENNGGVVKSDLSGDTLVKPEKSQKGVTPSPNEWQIDHIVPKDKGGSNSYSNAQVLSRKENRDKSNK